MFVRKVLGVASLGLVVSMVAGCSGNAGDEEDGGSQCESDADCKGDRICEDGTCVEMEPSSTSGGASGSQGSGNGGSSGPGGCVDAGSSCSAASCCVGSRCVDIDDGLYCAANCVEGSDCVSGCCAQVDGGNPVCAPTSYCVPLKPVGMACSSDSECASNDCIGWCTQGCSSSSDCDGGYCVENTSNENLCFPSCGDTDHCSTFPGTTCQPSTSVDGIEMMVCSS